MINRNQNKVYNYGNIQIRKNPNDILNQRPTNNSLKKNIASNTNLNNRNMNNILQTKNQNSNYNINNNDDVINKAILLIRNECKKKDDRIRELQNKVNELTKKLNSLLLNNNISTENNNGNNLTEGVKPFDPNNENEEGGFINRIGRDIRGYSLGNTGINNKNNPRSNSHMQSIKQSNINYNSDSENVMSRGFNDNLSHSNDRSVLTYNGGSQTSSKAEVKSYLKEVKSRVEPRKFKEFIRNIKLLTAKSNTSINKEIIVESVRKLFGEENKDLFFKFEIIIGYKNNEKI